MAANKELGWLRSTSTYFRDNNVSCFTHCIASSKLLFFESSVLEVVKIGPYKRMSRMSWCNQTHTVGFLRTWFDLNYCFVCCIFAKKKLLFHVLRPKIGQAAINWTKHQSLLDIACLWCNMETGFDALQVISGATAALPDVCTLILTRAKGRKLLKFVFEISNVGLFKVFAQ